MPLPKVPQRGDAARLQQLASGLKMEHGTYGAVVQRNDVGRPTGSGGTPAPRESAQKVPPVSAEQQAMFGELARAELARQYWSALAAQSPTPWIQAMKDIAEQNYRPVAERVYGIIPNQEF